MRQYEAMFIFDATFAADSGNVDNEVGRLMERAGAEIIVSRKWEERRLAFDIKKRKRGCYVLTYFRADPDRIAGIEHDVALSEKVLRVLILNAEGLSREHMESKYPAKPAERVEPAVAEAPAAETKGDGATAKAPEPAGDTTEKKPETAENAAVAVVEEPAPADTAESAPADDDKPAE